ncbi:hypothetical protein OHB12_02165 [Nocardia sp. NBC_01730]|nr:hypothetical protein OHB12_02165 [Nocardia sp. NBC_01730]
MTATDVVMAIAMLAAMLAKTAPPSGEETAIHAWSLLERGLHG